MEVGGADPSGLGNGTIVNQGLISADTANRRINIFSRGFQNQGVLEARNGGVLGIQYVALDSDQRYNPKLWIKD